MKKLQSRIGSFGNSAQVLTRAQLKNVMGGGGKTTSRSCHSVTGCDDDNKNGEFFRNCPGDPLPKGCSCTNKTCPGTIA